MKDLTVILTACGGVVSPGMMNTLRIVKERNIRIIGVDTKEDCIGYYLADRGYKVPKGMDPDYIEKMLAICKKENVDAIMPCSPEEFFALSKNIAMFEKMGIKIITSCYKNLKLADDKGSMCQILERKGIPHTKYFLPKNIEEFRKCAEKLGYPERDFIIKPRSSRGSRGFHIITQRKRHDMKERGENIYSTLDDITRLLNEEPFPEIIMMEYLPGEEYSVDVLARKGEVIVMVPKVRVETVPGSSTVALVKKNEDVEELVKRVVGAFELDYNINVQVKYSYDGVPLPYEINPRIAATIAACTAAGVNMLYYALKLAFDEPLPKIHVEDGIKMIRFWKELYVKNGAHFFL